MLRHFNHPRFTYYDSKTNLVERDPLHSTDVFIFLKWWFDVQSVSIQPRAHDNEVVKRFKEGVHTKLQRIDLGIQGPIYHLQSGPPAHQRIAA